MFHTMSAAVEIAVKLREMRAKAAELSDDELWVEIERETQRVEEGTAKRGVALLWGSVLRAEARQRAS